ncbi:MAG: alpha/beta fold hydrolase [Chlamydiia bacterium]|nr:alpha/beta fold hydrolase [Chlamydiia bacterium]
MLQTEVREWVTIESEGFTLFGICHRPRDGARGPAVLTCHGFGGTKVGRFRLYVNLAEELASRGVTVLRLDFRGSGDSEGELPQVSVQGQIQDALAGLRFLEGYDGVDPTRIGLLGSSMGGAVAVNAAARHGGIKSFGLWAPLFCPQKWIQSWATTQPGFSFSEPTVEGWPVSPEFIQGFVSLNVQDALAELGETPMLHVHGEQDKLVLIDHAEEYERSRRDARVESRFVRLPEADHVFTRPADRRALLDQTTQWFVETL